MKLPESVALEILEEHGLPHVKSTVVFDQLQLDSATERARIRKELGLANDQDQVVAKVDAPVGGKAKAGLMVTSRLEHLGPHLDEIFRAGRKAGIEYENYLVEEFVAHDKEYYLAIKAVREGLVVYFSSVGGIDVEANWDKVQSFLIPTQKVLEHEWPSERLAHVVQPGSILSFLEELLNVFQWEDLTYLEINPLAITPDFKVLPLGLVMELDDAAIYRHPGWADFYGGNIKSEREKIVAETDKEIRGSVKLVEVPGGGDTAVMAGGAGAALFLCDAVMAAGKKLANYAEFSGNPPNWALTELTKQVCAIPGLKNLVIGSGIANFTNVKNNIEAIIEGLRVCPTAKMLNIVVRRCGPGEEEGVKLMKDFAQKSGLKIKVYGRETPMTEIVKYV